MKKESLIACLSILFLVVAVSLSNAYAGGREGGPGYPGGRPFGPKCGGGLEGKFFAEAHCILENREELGLPEDKVEEIKNLKLETKKTLIKQNAEIEILNLDIMAKLHAYPVDAATVNKLMDQKYELKKAEAKSLVEAIAKLQGTLTKDQYDKLCKLWKGKEKEGQEGHKKAH